MLYAALKLLHLLASIAWIGGMFFVLACLRPALPALDPPQRPRLMNAVLGRFLRVVEAAIGVLLLSGLAMLGLAWHGAGHLVLPFAWIVMIVIGLVMMGVFGALRGTQMRRLRAALQAQDGPGAIATLGRMRALVLLNLVLGVIVVAAMKLAPAV